MPVNGPRYEPEEFARRGGEIYDQAIRALVEQSHDGEFVGIDIETRDWEVDPDDFLATERLLARVPRARIWLVRVGRAATYRIGSYIATGE